MDSSHRINLAEVIQGPWQHAVVVTYGLDLGFFERAILPQISQTRGRLVLADATELLAHQAAAARGRLVRHLNHTYAAGGISVSGAAHAKIILLLNELRGRLLVGSGNLRLTGWGSAGELFTRYDLDEEDKTWLSAFLSVKDLLDGLAERRLMDDFAAAYLREIWSRTGWLEDGSPKQETPLRHNLHTSLLDQLIEAIDGRGKPQEVTMFAPFHDPTCSALTEILNRTQPKSATLLVQPRHTSIDPASLGKVMARHPNLVVRPFGPRSDQDRYVHAKLIQVRFKNEVVCLQGSANLSRAALLMTAPKGNLEAGNLLIAPPKRFDQLLTELWIGKPIEDPASLNVELRVEKEELPEARLRLLEASWDGELLALRVSGSVPRGPSLWVRVGPSLVRGRRVRVESDPRPGETLVHLNLGEGVDDLFSRAVPIALYLEEGDPPAHVADDQLSEPIYCLNQPSLTVHMEARPASMRLRDIGLLSLDSDAELEELLRALQGTMIYDRRTLVEARPPPVPLPEDADDEELRIAYSDIDYEKLRAVPRLQQYSAGLSLTSGTPGLMPTGIQIALRSITDAFSEIVGRGQTEARATKFSSDWTSTEENEEELQEGTQFQEDQVSLIEGPGVDGEGLQELENVAERRWSDAARLRLHWRNFIKRYLRGLESLAWQELVGTAVLSGNYEVFSHILQRLHRQPWKNLEFLEFLLRSQAYAHAFVWGGPGKSDAPGWLAALPATERDLVIAAFSERHVAVRLLVDLTAAAAVTRPGQIEGSDKLSDERRLVRDVARAVLVHPSWHALAPSEIDLVTGAASLAENLTGGGEFACWLEPPSASRLIDDLHALLAFMTPTELRKKVGQLARMDAEKVQSREVRLGPKGRQVLARDLEIEGLKKLDLETCLAIMSLVTRVYQADRYRVHAGRSRLLYEPRNEQLDWVPDLMEEVTSPGRLPPIQQPWDSVLSSLAESAEESDAQGAA